MERSERDLRPVPSAPADAVAEAGLWDVIQTQKDPDQVPGAWLALQCRAVRGCRRGLLLLGPPGAGPFRPAASWPDGQPPPAPLVSAAERALIDRMGVVLTPEEPASGEPPSLESAIVAEPVELAGELHGAVVLEVSPRPPAELQALRTQLRLGFGWLETFAGRREEAAEAGGKARLETVLGLLAAALDHSRFQGAASAFVTELSAELGCDRVSAGFLRGQSVRVRALSHSAQFGERSNLIRAVEAVMDEALDQQASVVFPAPDSEVPRAAHAHAELARQFGSGSICTVPLLLAGDACGAITLERGEPFDPTTVRLVEVAAALAGPVLELQRREDRNIAAKGVETVRRFLGHLIGPHHVVLKLVTAALVGLVLFLSLAKGEYRLTADSILEPDLLRAAVAPFEGFVAKAEVRAGDVVAEGQLLASLDDRDLVLERVRSESTLAQALKQYRQVLADRDAAETEIQAAAVREARADLERIEDRLSRIELRAPFDGVVVAGDLSQRLGSPVEQGEVLFEVAPLETYRIHLQIDERDVAHVAEGQTGTLMLTALPGESFEFEVEKITPVSSAEEGRNTFRVEAYLQDAGDRLRPGVEGVAKVVVGERRLIWIWTHEAVAWLRLKLWAWLP